MRAADLVARLAKEGIDPSLLAEVAQELFGAEVERKILAERRKNERERKADQRAVSRDVTGQSGTNADVPSGPKTVPPKDINQTPSGTDLPDEASASSPVRQPISEAKAIWDEAAGKAGWPQVRVLSANRQKLLGARLREHGLDGWRAAIAKARASPFLAGADPPSWFTFPWLIKSENFLKLIEGNYDRRTSGNTLGRHQPTDGLSSTSRAALQVFGR